MRLCPDTFGAIIGHILRLCRANRPRGSLVLLWMNASGVLQPIFDAHWGAMQHCLGRTLRSALGGCCTGTQLAATAAAGHALK